MQDKRKLRGSMNSEGSMNRGSPFESDDDPTFFPNELEKQNPSLMASAKF
jgi:hypothetical protein